LDEKITGLWDPTEATANRLRCFCAERALKYSVARSEAKIRLFPVSPIGSTCLKVDGLEKILGSRFQVPNFGFSGY